MRNARLLFALLTAASVGVVCEAEARPAAAANNDQLLAQVRAAWEARERATRKIRMSWTFTCLTPKGARKAITPGAKDDQPRPAVDTKYEGKASLLLDGLTAKYTLDSQIWLDPESRFVPYQIEATFADGTITKVRHTPVQSWPSGFVRKGAWNEECGELSNWPVTAAVRGGHPQVLLSGGLEAFTESRQAIIDSRNVVELIQPRTEVRGELKVCLLPDNDYFPVRYEFYHTSGELLQRVSVTPRRHTSGIWLPGTWTASSFSGRRLQYTISATMTAIEVDPSVGPADFAVNFPPGTKVYDDTAETTETYLVKEGGQKRVILPEEILADHEGLMQSETGDLVPGPRKPRWVVRNWWVLAAGVLGLACAVWIAVRMTRRVARETKPSNGGEAT